MVSFCEFDLFSYLIIPPYTLINKIFYQKITFVQAGTYADIHLMDGKRLLDSLPLCLRTMNWGEISQARTDLLRKY